MILYHEQVCGTPWYLYRKLKVATVLKLQGVKYPEHCQNLHSRLKMDYGCKSDIRSHSNSENSAEIF